MLPAFSSAGDCDDAASMVDSFVTENFDPKLMEGTYYELAYHDYTQPKICGCERSVKTVDTTVDPVQIHDLFTLKCPAPNGKDQITHLEFLVNDTVPGSLSGDCSFFKQSVDGTCPDYLIDVGTRVPGEPYPWVLEFQCVEKKNGDLLFAGVNMYSRDKSEASLTEMIESADAHGLTPFIEQSERWFAPAGLTIVNHTDCTYPDENATSGAESVDRWAF